MSKPLQYDSLLVRGLWRALHGRYRGVVVRSIRFEPDHRTVRLNLGRRTLVWDLDPLGGALYEEPARGPRTGVMFARGARVLDVCSPPDERVIEWRFGEPGSERLRHLWIELLPNRRNAVLTSDGSVIAMLVPRPGEGADAQESGQWYPPDPHPRQGADIPLSHDAFVSLLREVPPTDRRRRLLASAAYTSPINAGSILGEAAATDTGEALAGAYARYLAIVSGTSARPGLLEPGGRDQPYPTALPGQDFSEATDLLAAFAAAATAGSGRREDALSGAIEQIERRCRSIEVKLSRLREELAGAAPEASRLRQHADLLMSQLDRVRKGMREVVLDDWSGGRVTVELDPALDPAANAARLYEQARKRERAAGRLPRLIDEGKARLDRLRSLSERAVAGEVTVAELTAELPASRVPTGRNRTGRALPYRIYHTRGGLEVRVGRGARANDELTLHHSSPEDVWLHARNAAGAHVVLRWGRRDANPPAADLAEAATLAALHSRARTSGTVAVDWTRRKYVRKPRKSPPGRVVMERAATLFVQPDREVEKRLRRE